MSTDQTPYLPEGEIDLRKLIVRLANYWWIILAITMIFTAAGAVVSFWLQPTVYQAEGGIVLPANGNEGGLQFTRQQHLEMSESSQVLEIVREQLGLEEIPGQLRNRFFFTLDDDGVLIATASAESAEGAYELVNAWIESYREVVSSQFDSKFQQAESEVNQEVATLLPQSFTAEQTLERFNLQHPPGSLEVSLSQIRTRLSERERLVRILKLESGREQELSSVGGGGTLSSSNPSLILEDLNEADSGNSLLNSPTYIELGESLTTSLLERLTEDLIESEARLRELAYTSIPIGESKLKYLEKALSEEPRFLDQPGGVESGTDGPTPNPVFLELSQQLANTRVTLEVERHEMEIQRKNIAALESRIGLVNDALRFPDGLDLNPGSLSLDTAQIGTLELEVEALQAQMAQAIDELITERFERRRLEAKASQLRNKYVLAKSEQDRLAEIKSDLSSEYQLTTVREPSFPESPVSPQRTRNLLLSVFLGLVIGGMAALLVSYYKDGRSLQETPGG